jgi:creatinine amidohydrolase
MKPVLFHEMRPADIRAAREACPVAFLPMGVLEWHGVHNPVGLDCVKATAMAEQFARNIGGVAMPPVWWGDHRAVLAELVFDAKTSGDFDHRPGIMEGHGLDAAAFEADAQRSESEGGWELFEQVLRHTMFEITTLGFRAVVTISGHYPLATPAYNVSQKFNKLGRGTMIPIIGYDLVEDQFTGDHAAKWETSLLMHLRPELVDLSLLDPDPENKPIGVLGEDPRTLPGHEGASAEYGRRGMDAMTEALRERVAEALREDS